MTRLQSFFYTIEIFTGYLDLLEIQKILKEDLKSKSGIYGFLCKTNNKLYIDSSIDLSSRFYEHINGSRSNILLQNAINKSRGPPFILMFVRPTRLRGAGREIN